MLLMAFEDQWHPSSLVLAKVNDTLKSYGLSVKFDDLSVGLDAIVLTNVNVSGRVQLVAKQIEIGLNLVDSSNPISEVEISGIRGSLDRNLVDQALSRSPQAPTGAKSDTIRPKNIVIRDAELNIYPFSNDVTDPTKVAKFRGLNATYYAEDQILTAQIDRFEFLDHAESEIFLSAKKIQSGISFFANNRVLGETNYWHSSGTVDLDHKIIKSTIKVAGIPKPLERFNKYFLQDQQLLSTIHFEVPFDQKDQIPFRFKYETSNLAIHSKTLHKYPVGPIAMTIAGRGHYTKNSSGVDVENGYIKFNGGTKAPILLNWKLQVSDLKSTPFNPNFNLAVALPETKCKAIADAVPPNFLPVTQDFRFLGSINFSMNAQFALASLEDFKQGIVFNNHCEMIPQNPQFTKEAILNKNSPYYASEEFDQQHEDVSSEVADNHSQSPSINPNYTVTELISPYLLQALVAFEDGGFYQHDGIQMASLIQALKRNLKAKKVSVGGSTITMQTVKNLFLTRERTVQRKLQELVLSWYLEQILSKKKILEIYANIIEYGPDIYGITKASKQFFGKTPYQLTLRESAYLALILPSPVIRFKHYCSGKPSQSFKSYLDARLRMMHARNFISDQELYQGIGQRLQFVDSALNPYCQSIASVSEKSETF